MKNQPNKEDRKFTEEHKRKIGEAIRRFYAENKSRFYMIKNCTVCGKEYLVHIKSRSHSRYCSWKCYKMGYKGENAWNFGKKTPEETKEKIRKTVLKNPSRYWLGKDRSEETKRKLSEYMRIHACRGSKHYAWKDDRSETSRAKRARNVFQFEDWRDSVFKRDNFTCLLCGNRGGYLEAHHVKRFTDSEELRYESSNGVTLCRECHNLTKGKESVWEQKFQNQLYE